MSYRFFLGCAIAVAAVRLMALPLPGTEDVSTFRVWAHFAAAEGVSGLYGTGGWPPNQRQIAFDGESTVVDYPPAALLYLQAAGTAYRAYRWQFSHPFSRMELTIAIKLLTVAAAMTVAGLVWLLTRRLRDERSARLAAMAYWANPTVILHGAALGYLGSLAFAPALGALLAAALGRTWICGALLALGVLTKPQAVFAAPAILMLLAAGAEPGRRVTSATLAALIVTALLLSPYAMAGTTSSLLHAVGALTAGPVLSAAANFWWVVGALSDGQFVATIRDTREVWPQPYVIGIWPLNSFIIGAVGWGSVAAIVAWASWRAWMVRSLASAVALAAFTVHVYFILALQVHEGHFSLALPLLAILAAADPRYRGLFVAASVAFGLNLLLFYDLLGGRSYRLPSRIGPLQTSIVVAVLNVLVFVQHWRLFRLCVVPGQVPALKAGGAIREST